LDCAGSEFYAGQAAGGKQSDYNQLLSRFQGSPAVAEIKKLGRYELRNVLGKGAMGVVYEGFDPSLGRRVAVKTILKSVGLDAETERAYAARFTLEAKAVARLNHPNIVQVYDFGVESDAAFLVMEFIQGRELRSFFNAGESFSQAESVRVMGELLDALDFAHEAGVVHRDVKPANVMLDGQRRVKLTDFGVARVQDSDRSAAGTMVGTPAFMSPEQISGGKIDRRTDLFSAGVVLYQLLTGEQPFKGSGAWTVAKQIMQDDPPQPSALVTNVSPAFDAIVVRALAKKPADRYANAREFAAALRAAIGVAPAALSLATSRPTPQGAGDAEVEFWRSIQNSRVAAEFEAYLKRFPEGTYAELAQVKLKTLRTTRDEATVALSTARRKSVAIAAVLIAVLFVGIAGYLHTGREARVTPPKVELSAVDVDKGRKESEDRISRELADKSAAEQAAAKAATEKALQQKEAELRAAADNAAREKALADKMAAEKALAAKTASYKAAPEKIHVAKSGAADKDAAERGTANRAIAERVAAERATADKATAEKAAAEYVAAEKAASEKAALPRPTADKAADGRQVTDRPVPERTTLAVTSNARPGWPSVGDRWVYEARNPDRSENRYQIAVQVLSVSSTEIRDLSRISRSNVEHSHEAGAMLIGIAPGVANFSPYLRAFQELRPGDRWRNVDLMQLWDCDSTVTCNVSARVVGIERVSVKAGTFDAWKVAIELHVSGTQRSGVASMISWYAEGAKRIVKYQFRQNIGIGGGQPWTQPNMDMELISYTPAK
jgi:tRNA A-37 threonylcarbamoyl transferase component Bud32